MAAPSMLPILGVACALTMLFYMVYVQPFKVPLAQPQIARNDKVQTSPCPRKENASSGCAIKHFQNVLLALTFNSPFYRNIPILYEMYGGVFGKIVTCGRLPDDDEGNAKNNGIVPDIIFKNRNGYLGYECLGLAVEKFPGYEGYLYGNDDMIINWWTLLAYDKRKVWQGPEMVDFRQATRGDLISKGWIWWTTDMGIQACQAFHQSLVERVDKPVEDTFNAKEALRIYLENGEGKPRCGKGWSDFYYVPGHMSKQFRTLSKIAFTHQLFLEIAVNNIIQSLDLKSNFEILKGVYMPDIGADTSNRTFWKIYTRQLTFIHPYKMGTPDFDLKVLNKKVIDFKRSLCGEL